MILELFFNDQTYAIVELTNEVSNSQVIRNGMGNLAKNVMK